MPPDWLPAQPAISPLRCGAAAYAWAAAPPKAPEAGSLSMLLVPIKAGSAANSPGLSFPIRSSTMAGSGKQVALLLPPLGRAAAMRLRLVADARPAVELAATAGKEGQQSELRIWQKCMCSACWRPGGRRAGRVLPLMPLRTCAAPCRRSYNTSQTGLRISGPAACSASAVQSADRGSGAVRHELLHAATPDARCCRGTVAAADAPWQGSAELIMVLASCNV